MVCIAGCCQSNRWRSPATTAASVAFLPNRSNGPGRKPVSATVRPVPYARIGAGNRIRAGRRSFWGQERPRAVEGIEQDQRRRVVGGSWRSREEGQFDPPFSSSSGCVERDAIGAEARCLGAQTVHVLGGGRYGRAADGWCDRSAGAKRRSSPRQPRPMRLRSQPRCPVKRTNSQLIGPL